MIKKLRRPQCRLGTNGSFGIRVAIIDMLLLKAIRNSRHHIEIFYHREMPMIIRLDDIVMW